MKHIVALSLASLLLAGCSESKQDAEPQFEGAIPAHQLKALEKAGSVEQSLLDVETQRRREAERQSQ